jgi:biotin-(acetyl-CoA carboxylase) ligase
VADQKLGGILIETVRGESLRFVVGFGINLNNRVRDLDAGFLPQPQTPSGEAHRTLFPLLPPTADSMDPSEAPPWEVARRATSLIELLGRELPIQNVLWSALNSLGHHYRELAESRYPLLERWPRYCFLTGRKIQIRMGDRLLAGVCQGIDARGALTLATATGQQSCFAGEVEWDEKGT